MNYPNCIKEALIKSDISPELKGFDMLCDAILLRYYWHEFDVNYIDKIIYPNVAQNFKTTTSSVERAIQYTITSAYDKFNHFVKEVTGQDKFDITNIRFIITYEEMLHDEITKELGA